MFTLCVGAGLDQGWVWHREPYFAHLSQSASLISPSFPALLRQKVDEVGKQTEQRRREQERSFRLVSCVCVCAHARVHSCVIISCICKVMGKHLGYSANDVNIMLSQFYKV